MRHKVSELEGELLDAAVALAEGWVKGSYGLDGFRPDGQGWTAGRDGRAEWYIEPWPHSSEWAYGGPLIERERINVKCWRSLGDVWQAGFVPEDAATVRAEGPTPLIAAMRAYVASKFGDKIDLP
jgi:hypothetical protein